MNASVKWIRGAHHRLAVVAASLLLAGSASAQVVDTTLWVPNGQVYATAREGNTLYIGGNFTMVGPATGCGVAIDTATSGVRLPCPNVIGGNIQAVIPDGNGGWFIGGSFDHVLGQVRNGLAQIDAAGNLTAWNPNPNATVFTLALASGTVYVGGSFTSIAGQVRNRLAAVDAVTGAANGWNPNADGYVGAMVYMGGTVYVAGGFSHVGGATRHYLAALETFNGLAIAWNPDPDDIVTCLAYSNNTVYAGGSFSFIGATPRHRLVALDSATGVPSSWNPNPDNTVEALLANGNTIYAGGTFSNVGGQARSYLAALDAITGQASSWNPAAGGSIRALALSGATLYAGGTFLTMGGQPRPRLASVSTATGAVTGWNPSMDASVLCLAVAGGTVFAGGSFGSVGAQSRNNLAALDATTGHLTSWNPNADNRVQKLVLVGNTLYVGGDFTTVAGQSRVGLGAVDATSGAVTSWNPHPNGVVAALAIVGNTAYVSGLFDSLGGQPRSYLGAVDVQTGVATSWNPAPNGWATAFAVNRGILYAGGGFTTMAGQTRRCLASFSLANGTLQSWNPNVPTGSVIALAADWNTIYAGGSFTSVNGTTRNRIAALDPVGGGLYAWNPNASNQVTALAVHGGLVYAGGLFATIGGQARPAIAALDPATGNATSFDAGIPNTLVSALDARSGSLLIGGAFGSAGSFPARDLARVTIPCAPFVRSVTALAPVNGSASWGDYDNDGRLDIALNGSATGGDVTRVHRNDGGSGATFPANGSAFAGTEQGNVAWGDYDRDGDLDFLAVGWIGSGGSAKLYRNDAGVFVDAVANLPGVYSGMAAWGDYDSDGDLDLAIAGQGDTTRWTRIYRNSGGASPTFTDAFAGLVGGTSASVTWADYDNDGDLDLLVMGATTSSFTKLYRNGGGANPSFAEASVGIDNISAGCAAWGDYDNDGDLDLAMTGATTVNVSRLYRNSGGANPTFTSVAAPFETGTLTMLAWGDYDGDGDLDLAVAGGPNLSPVTKIYLSSGGANPTFSDAGAGLLGQTQGSVAWGDFDRDGDLDLLLSGYGAYGSQSELMRSDCVAANTPPQPPSGLSASLAGNTATFDWLAANDAQGGSLTYNLRVGTTPGGGDVVAPMAGATGERRVAAMGNAQLKRSRAITLTGTGPWYWSVQAIDGTFAGSTWAPEQVVGTTAVGDGRAALDYALWIEGANPSRGSASIGFSLPSREIVSVSLHDVSGRRVRQLVGESLPAGRYARVWDGRDDAGQPARPGMYFVRLEAGGVAKARKVTVLQ